MAAAGAGGGGRGMQELLEGLGQVGGGNAAQDPVEGGLLGRAAGAKAEGAWDGRALSGEPFGGGELGEMVGEESRKGGGEDGGQGKLAALSAATAP